MISSFLNRKISFLDRKSNRYLLILTVFLFCLIFLNVYEPFNIARWYSDSGLVKFMRLSSYGFVIALVFLFTQFPLRKAFKIEHFTVKTYIIWLVIELTLINLIYILIYGNPIGNFFNDLVFSMKYTLMSIWLPYSFALLVILYRNHKTEIDNLRSIQPKKQSANGMIVFKDENSKIKFSVLSSDILLLESTDNYVSVYYFIDKKVQRKLIRNSLKNMEQNLSENGMIRCHRSFMINSANIEFVQREGKKFNIKLKHLEKEIPVSEKYSSPFMRFLS